MSLDCGNLFFSRDFWLLPAAENDYCLSVAEAEAFVVMPLSDRKNGCYFPSPVTHPLMGFLQIFKQLVDVNLAKVGRPTCCDQVKGLLDSLSSLVLVCHGGSSPSRCR